MGSLNTFANHAPKFGWLKDFFEDPDNFLKHNFLGSNQIRFFRRFLFDAELVDRKTKKVTDFTRLVKKIGWNSAEMWGLIFINLVYNNPQMRWYVENMPIGKTFPRRELEKNLRALKISINNSQSITYSFKRLCATPLGMSLNFGLVTTNGRNLDTLTRTRAKITDSRVILYSLFRFAEACENYLQFTLTRALNTVTISKGVTPAQLFGVEREEMEQILNGLSIRYSTFIHASFTHDLEKISLSEDKTAADVLKLFEG